MLRFVAILVMQCILHFGCMLQAGAQNCLPPLIFTGNEISDTSIILRWFSVDLPDQGYLLNIQERGTPPHDSLSLFVATPQERDTIYSLQPQTAYKAYIRSVCDGDTSAYKSFDFFTALRNGLACQLDIGITDNSCSRGGQDIPVFVKDLPADTLGGNIKLQSIQLIIDHPYPADLDIAISNPSGNTLQLIKNHGTFTDNFGNPNDSTCNQVVEFSISSCESIYDSDPPFIGQHSPDEEMSVLNDGTGANGKWILKVCDRASDDKGTLKHIQLNFTLDVCPQAPNLLPYRLGDSSQLLSFDPFQADSFKILYSMDSLAPKDVSDSSYFSRDAMPFDSIVALSGLAYNTTYHVWSFIYCGGNWIGPSCAGEFTTLRSSISLYSNWEEEDICDSPCSVVCPLADPVWQNSGYAWNVQQGPTPTGQTGPERDVFYYGKYLYKESSQIECRQNESLLQSICLEKADSISGLSFYYQLNGIDVGSLILLLSQDEWLSYDTLWAQNGNKGEGWKIAHTAIPDSTTGPFQLRFIAMGSTSAFGDIAIGDIAMYGIAPVSIMDQLFFPDRDGDGYGNIDTAIFYCGSTIPDSLSSIVGDCNDNNVNIHPNARDTVCNGVDEDCNGMDNLGGFQPLSIEIDSLKYPSCPDNRDGYISLAISGGVPPYSIFWSTGSSALRLDSLQAGEYSVLVTDSIACQTRSRTIQLESARPVNFSFEVIERPSCPSPEFGTVEVSISGGTPPYEVFWSNGEKGLLADSLPPGNFHVTVMDFMNCKYRSTDQLITSQQAYPIEVIEVRPISCPADSDGSLRVLAPGSLPPLEILWNTGDTSKTINNLQDGYYSVTVTDANGCALEKDSFLLEDPNPIRLSELIIEPQRCAGENSASVFADAIGGTPPYAFRWSKADSNILTGAQLNDIGAGFYSLTISDSKGCIFTKDSIHVKGQEPISLDSLLIKATTCPLSRDGKIEFSIVGGSGSYRISWSDGVIQTSSRSSLNSGLYGVTVTDALDCKFTSSNLRVPRGNKGLDVELYVFDSLFCGSNDSASIIAEVFDGTEDYQYNWSVGVQHTSDSPTDTLAQLMAGRYSVTVTDGIGCVGTSETIRIDSLAPVLIDNISTSDISCPGEMNGKIHIMARSSLGKVRYNWSNGSSGQQLDSLSPGTYQVTISDASHCKPRIFDFLIGSPDSLVIDVDSFRSEGRSCFKLDSISGGTTPYSYFWKQGENASDSNIYCPPATATEDLFLEITDDKECNYSILIREGSTQNQNHYTGLVKVFPNPFSDQLTVGNNSRSPVKLMIRDIKGVILFQNKLEVGSHSLHLPGLASGLYIMSIQLEDGRLISRKLIRE